MFTADWENKIIDSDVSITDIPVARGQLRALEDSVKGILYDPIITYKQIPLGGGAFFPAIDFINGYSLRFPNPGNYTIDGNLSVDIIPNYSVFVERKTSAAFAVTTAGGGGIPSQDKEDIANLVVGKGVLLEDTFLALK